MDDSIPSLADSSPVGTQYCNFILYSFGLFYCWGLEVHSLFVSRLTYRLKRCHSLSFVFYTQSAGYDAMQYIDVQLSRQNVLESPGDLNLAY